MQPLTITATTPYFNRLSIQANLKDYAWVAEYMLEERRMSIAQIMRGWLIICLVLTANCSFRMSVCLPRLAQRQCSLIL